MVLGVALFLLPLQLQRVACAAPEKMSFFGRRLRESHFLTVAIRNLFANYILARSVYLGWNLRKDNLLQLLKCKSHVTSAKNKTISTERQRVPVYPRGKELLEQLC